MNRMSTLAKMTAAVPRVLVVLGLLAASADAGADVRDRVFVVRVVTEQATNTGTRRNTLAAPAIVAGPDGLLMVVGLAIEPDKDNHDTDVRVTAVGPKGWVWRAKLLGTVDDLECTFVRLVPADDRKMPKPVDLEAPPELGVGDPVRLFGRHGPLFRHAPRERTLKIEAVARGPQRLYALSADVTRWIGSMALTSDGRLLGFLDTRPTMPGRRGAMLGLGAQTVVVVPADVYAAAARRPPGQVKGRAWLGVNLAPFDEDREAFFSVKGDWNGALVTGVASGSPAADAGLEVHDLVRSIGPLRIRHERAEDWNIMLRAVQRLPLGQPLECDVVRFTRRADGEYDAKEIKRTLTLRERPLAFAEVEEQEVADLGIKVKPLTDDYRRTLRLGSGIDGVVVTRIARAAPVQLAGLRSDDIILRVDEHPVPDVATLKRVATAAKKAKRKKIALFVRRGRRTLFLAVDTNW